jgi:hypothetical protein
VIAEGQVSPGSFGPDDGSPPLTGVRTRDGMPIFLWVQTCHFRQGGRGTRPQREPDDVSQAPAGGFWARFLRRSRSPDYSRKLSPLAGVMLSQPTGRKLPTQAWDDAWI